MSKVEKNYLLKKHKKNKKYDNDIDEKTRLDLLKKDNEKRKAIAKRNCRKAKHKF